jgi:hypothetical protein
MARQKLGIEGQIMVAIKRGYTTNSELAGYLCVGRSTIDKTCTDMTIAGMIHAKKIRNTIFYSLIEEVNAHDPFKLCQHKRTGSDDSQETILQPRRRHLLLDERRT